MQTIHATNFLTLLERPRYASTLIKCPTRIINLGIATETP
jgi:hypothetical protein